ncbi:MAG TPA: HPr family phosphocarrier protein [Nevskiaceae bacterium]|nr:HPr family phosphocarrier protein [Nevskiaceae bacterium]
MERTVPIVNRLGLHARAAARLVTLAAKFESTIRIRKGEREVSGKSIMGVMMLAAAQGSEITLVAEGSDAAQALQELTQLIAERFGEEA